MAAWPTEAPLERPCGVAIDGSGHVYVSDARNDRIRKYTTDGAFISGWGTSGSGDGQFDAPRGVAVDGVGNVYVADGGNNRIQRFTSDGTFIAKWGTRGGGDGQ